MANINLYTGINLNNLDFYRIFKGWAAPFDIGPQTFLGINYAQVGELWWTYGSDIRVSYFAGTNVNYTGDGWYTPLRITSGQFTGYLETSYYSGNLFYIDAFSASAVRLYRSIISSSRNDDYALIRSILSGEDNIYGSSRNDIISSYNGDDYISPGSGTDIINAGSGNDLVELSGDQNQYNVFWTRNTFNANKSGDNNKLINVEKIKFADSDDIFYTSQLGRGSVVKVTYQTGDIYLNKLTSNFYALDDNSSGTSTILLNSRGGRMNYANAFSIKYATTDSEANEATVISRFRSFYYKDSFNAATGKLANRTKYTNTSILDLENTLSTDLNGDDVAGWKANAIRFSDAMGSMAKLTNNYFGVHNEAIDTESEFTGTILLNSRGGRMNYANAFSIKYATTDSEANEATVISRFRSFYYKDSFNAATGKLANRTKYTNTSILDLENTLSTDLNGDGMIGDFIKQIKISVDDDGNTGLYKSKLNHYYLDSTGLSEDSSFSGEQVKLLDGLGNNAFNFNTRTIFKSLIYFNGDDTYSVFTTIRGKWYEYEFDGATGWLISRYNNIANGEIIRDEISMLYDINNDGSIPTVNRVIWSGSYFDPNTDQEVTSDYNIYGAIDDNTFVIDTESLSAGDNFTYEAGVIYDESTDAEYWTLNDGEYIYDFTKIDGNYYEILTTEDQSSFDSWIVSMNSDDTYANIIANPQNIAATDVAMQEREYYYQYDFDGDGDITAPLEIPEDWASYYNT